MRLLPCLLVALPLAACVPAKPVARRSANPDRERVPLAAENPAAPAPPPTALVAAPAHLSASVSPARVTSASLSGITFEGVSFDSRTHRLVVVDQPGGPGSKFPDALSAARSRGGLAAINASFFTPEGSVLGLAMSGGARSGAWNSASSLGNAVWYDGSGASGIVRRDALGRSAASSMRELVQAGPLLVENGRAVGGLEASKTSARSVVLWDGGTRWWIGRASPCSLAKVSAALATGRPGGWPVKQALNLDGGRSADLWISSGIPGGPLSRRTPFNRPVRNFLVLVEK